MPFLDRILFRRIPLAELTRFRLLFCVGLALAWVEFFFSLALPDLRRENLHPNYFSPIPLLAAFGQAAAPSTGLYFFLALTLALCLLAAGFGMRARTALALALPLLIFLLGSHMALDANTALTGVGRSKSSSLYILFLLFLTPDITRKGGGTSSHEETTAAWPLLLIKITVCSVFFSAGIAKLRSGIAWADGYTLQAYLLETNGYSSITQFFIDRLWLCRLLSSLVLAFELLCPLVLFFPRWEWLFVVMAIFFHLGTTYLLQLRGFLTFFLLGYFAFLSEAHWRKMRAWASPAQNKG